MHRILLLTFALCCAAFAQDTKPLDICMEEAETQSSMRECANEEAKRADAAMDEVYKKLLTVAHSAAPKIEAAQKAWITYRDKTVDAYCPEQPISQACGTLFFTESLLVRASLTWRQVEELKALLEHYTPK